MDAVNHANIVTRLNLVMAYTFQQELAGRVSYGSSIDKALNTNKALYIRRHGLRSFPDLPGHTYG